MNYDILADLLIPDVDKTSDYYAEFYPKRNLKADAKVTRYAPSPTGFQHMGGVFAALISERLAHQSEGIFYLRIEDTDKKREVEGAIDDTIRTLKGFNISFDEGMTGSDSEKGEYGPYQQSKRAAIYRAFAKDLIRKGLAYPCFCTEEELNETRKAQESIKANPGYYGKWAVHRDADFEEIKKNLDAGKPFVIRLKSPGDPEKRVVCNDLIRGEISFPQNEQDIVILKSDGIPTYHFAHAVDDFLMQTTHVIRGEEWLASLPVHLQLFEVLEITPPAYAHIPTIMKLDGGSKRKLSKRKDPESSVDYYREQGFPFDSVIEYLINLINSNYEEWRTENPTVPYTDFKIELGKMSQSGALFDIVKLSDISKDVIAKWDAETVYNMYLTWAKEYDTETAELLTKYPEYSKKIFNIGREEANPRKDISKWIDVRDYIGYFFDELFNKDSEFGLPGKVTLEEAKNILEEYKKIYNHNDNQDEWFPKLKELAINMGYAKDGRAYKKNPEAFKGVVADVAAVVRMALARKTSTPDLHQIMQTMGENRVIERLSCLS